MEVIPLDRWINKSEQLSSAHQPATGVVDSIAFAAATDRALAHSEDRAVVVIDLDGAPVSEGTFGALVTAAETRMARTIRPDDLLGRLEDGRFAVLTEKDGAVRVAIRLGDRLREPFDVGGQRVRLIPQVGVGYAESGIATAEGILREAASSPRY
jgi:GGDEF domain-containing protein